MAKRKKSRVPAPPRPVQAPKRRVQAPQRRVEQRAERRSPLWLFALGAAILIAAGGVGIAMAFRGGGGIGFWQGTFRDPADPAFAPAVEAIRARQRITIDLLYGDHEGGQRVISRYVLMPRDDGTWLASVARHWNVDREDPR